MEHDPKAYLFDIKQACDEIKNLTQGMSFEEYSLNSMVKAAVERKFLVIGEAKDRARDDALREVGMKVLRFSDRDVFENMGGVMERIWNCL